MSFPTITPTLLGRNLRLVVTMVLMVPMLVIVAAPAPSLEALVPNFGCRVDPHDLFPSRTKCCTCGYYQGESFCKAGAYVGVFRCNGGPYFHECPTKYICIWNGPTRE